MAPLRRLCATSSSWPSVTDRCDGPGATKARRIVALLVYAPQMQRRTVVTATNSEPPAVRVSPWRHSTSWYVTIFEGLQSLAF